MAGKTHKPPSVFISYSHDSNEHVEQVLALSNRLRNDGIDCFLDQYVDTPNEGWGRWMIRQIEQADFVLMICTENYYRRAMGEEEPGTGEGVKWEWKLILQIINDTDSTNDKFLPVLFENGTPEHIPDPLRGFTRYYFGTKGGYEQLYRRLTSHQKHAATTLTVSGVATNDQIFMPKGLPQDFVERLEEFKQLVSYLVSDDRRTPTAVSGAGGYGKTTLALAICHDSRIRETFGNGILWVALGEQPNVTGALRKLYAAVAGAQPHFVNEKDGAVALAEVLGDGSYLMVVDDVWNPAHLRPFLYGGPRCARLITTRQTSTLTPKTKRVEVGEMREAEALALLSARLPSSNRAQLRELAKRARNWPLQLHMINAALCRRVLELGQSFDDAVSQVNELLDKDDLKAFDTDDVLVPKDIDNKALRIGGRAEYRREAHRDEVCLNLEEYAQALSELFRTAGEDFNFGLFGHWGRGKTYLMEEVSKKLCSTGDYVTVRFSAWAYPHRPLLWVHLYEKLADRMIRGSPWIWVPRVLRAGIVRHGMWKLIGAIFAFAAVLMPTGLIYEFAKSLLSVIGIAGILLLIRVSRASSSLVNSIAPNFLRLSRHDDKLGLQSVIGKDLRALLLGWLPRGKGKSTPDTTLVEALASEFSAVKVIAFVIASLAAAICISPLSNSVTWEILSKSDIEWSKLVETGRWFAWALAVVWLALSIGGFLTARLCGLGSSSNRLLLVVDDLDRCEPAQMLNVIEDLELFLQTDDVQHRMQIAMLIDESILMHAIHKKYRYATAELIGGISVEDVVQENFEKLFVAWLRLPNLNIEELDEVAIHYLNKGQKAQTTTNALTPTTETTDSSVSTFEHKEESVDAKDPDNASTPENDEFDPAATPPPPKVVVDNQLTFTENEAKALRDAIRELYQSKQTHRLGPRSIRNLFFRYKLARLLLGELGGEQPDAHDLAIALISAQTGKQEASTPVERVAQQVTLPPPTMGAPEI